MFRRGYNPSAPRIPDNLTGGSFALGHDVPIADERTEQMAVASFVRAVSLALVQSGSVRDMLQACAEAMVEHLTGAFARIWTVDDSQELLLLQASAGLYTQIDGPYSRIRVGDHTIGTIARDRTPYLTNSLATDRPASNHLEWPVMPGMSGRQVVDRVRASYPTPSVLFISGYTDDAMVRHGIAEADTPFLQKPFTMSDLTRKVRQVLDTY